MKTIKSLIILSAVCALTLTSCNGVYKKGDRVKGTTSAKVDSISYALGAYFGSSIESADFGELSYDAILKGMKDKLNGADMKIEEQQIMQIIQTHLMARQSAKAENAISEGKAFLEENKAKEGVVETESGLQYKIVEEGTGIAPSAADTVEVHYKGTLLDGSVFDSSYDRKESVKFPLNRVIPGWTEGIQFAKEGGKIILYIPSDLAYGENGAGPSIPGNSTLVFEVELLKVYKTTESAK